MSIETDTASTDPDLTAALHALGSDMCWVADVVPLLRPGADTPDTRYAFVLIMAESVRVVADLIDTPVADNAATLIAEKLQHAIDATGVTPTAVIIRGHHLAEAVQRALPHLLIEAVDTLDDILDPTGPAFIAESLHLRRAMDGDSIPHAPAASAPRWQSWGIPLPHVAAFFTAAAALYRAANARQFSGDGEGTLFILDAPSTARLGASHETIVTLFGTRPDHSPSRPASVTIYTEPEDWDAMVDSTNGDPRAAEVHHPVMALHYDHVSEVAPAALDEIHTHGWDIAADTAYPRVWFLNLIGGGVTTAYVQTVTTQLAVLARAIAPSTPNSAIPLRPLNADLTLRYTDRATGITVRTIAD